MCLTRQIVVSTGVERKPPSCVQRDFAAKSAKVLGNCFSLQSQNADAPRLPTMRLPTPYAAYLHPAESGIFREIILATICSTRRWAGMKWIAGWLPLPTLRGHSEE